MCCKLVSTHWYDQKDRLDWGSIYACVMAKIKNKYKCNISVNISVIGIKA